MSTELELFERPIQFFGGRTSRRSAKKHYWNQISDFFTNSEIPDFDDSILIGAVEDCAEWKRYTEQDIDDIEILYERFDGKGKVLSTLSDEEETKPSLEAANLKIEGKFWVLSGLQPASFTDKKRQFQFPLPQGNGLKTLNTPHNFALPWNIYCPTVDGERSIVKWRHGLKRNQWLVENPFKDKRPTVSVCHCKGDGCGNRCINRLLQYECSPYNCTFGDRDCGNRAFSDILNAYRYHSTYASAIEVVQTEKKGCGLFSARSYNHGSLIVEYTGEVIDLDEVEHRLNTIYMDADNYYFLGLEDNFVIDAGQKGSVARFANHSCEPNAEMQKWYVDNEPRIGLFAKRPIQGGEEITYDYNFEWFENAEPQKCYCGSKYCRGFIGKRVEPGIDSSSEEELVGESLGKRASKPVSHPVKPTQIADSSSLSSDSDFDFEDDLALRLIESLKEDDKSKESAAPVPEPKPIKEPPKPKTSTKTKYTPGVKMKEVMVGDDEPIKSPPKTANTKQNSSSKAPPAEKSESPDKSANESMNMRTTRRSLNTSAYDYEIPDSLKNVLAIDMVKPGSRSEFEETHSIPASTLSDPRKVSTAKKPAPKKPSPKKRSPPAKSSKPPPPKRRKTIISDSEEENDVVEVPSLSKSVSEAIESTESKFGDIQELFSDDSADLPRFEVKKAPTENVKRERVSPLGLPKSNESDERHQPLKKKNPVFNSKRPGINKTFSEKSTSNIKSSNKTSSPLPDVFNLKKSKRRGPTQTTENYPSSSTPDVPSSAGNELVVAENEEYPQHPQQELYYDQWGNPYYADPYQQPYYPEPYYNDHYHQPQPQSHAQSQAPSQPQQPGYQQLTSYSGPPQPIPPSRNRSYPPNYGPGYRPPYPPQPPQEYGEYPSHPPQPRPPPRYYRPAPYGYPYPPPGYPSQPQPPVGYYPDYYGGPNAYPPGAFTVDAEADGMLVDSPDSFADEVLQQPEEEKVEPKKKDIPSARGVPVDPRKRKKTN